MPGLLVVDQVVGECCSCVKGFSASTAGEPPAGSARCPCSCASSRPATAARAFHVLPFHALRPRTLALVPRTADRFAAVGHVERDILEAGIARQLARREVDREFVERGGELADSAPPRGSSRTSGCPARPGRR